MAFNKINMLRLEATERFCPLSVISTEGAYQNMTRIKFLVVQSSPTRPR
jgi:hypothetical protein